MGLVRDWPWWERAGGGERDGGVTLVVISAGRWVRGEVMRTIGIWGAREPR